MKIPALLPLLFDFFCGFFARFFATVNRVASMVANDLRFSVSHSVPTDPHHIAFLPLMVTVKAFSFR
jgi:hypothetical protein